VWKKNGLFGCKKAFCLSEKKNSGHPENHKRTGKTPIRKKPQKIGHICRH
jgi:hypothetical protein